MGKGRGGHEVVRERRHIKRCSREGCPNVVIGLGEVCTVHEPKTRRICSQQGCQNLVVRGGVCHRHGAKLKKKRCSHEGCASFAIKGGVCKRHGAVTVTVKKLCSHEGCTKPVYCRGVCHRHGAFKRICSHEGCNNSAVQGGVCRRHGTKARRCSHGGCTNVVINGGLCIRHGAAKRKRCSHEGCNNQSIQGGVCKRHGAVTTRPICSHQGCTNTVIKGGVCVRHGAKVKRCSHQGCTNQSVKGGVCHRHGARAKVKGRTIGVDAVMKGAQTKQSEEVSGGEDKSDDKMEDAKRAAMPGPGKGETGSHVSEGKFDEGKTNSVGISCNGEASTVEEGHGNKSIRHIRWGESSDGIEFAAEGCISGDEGKFYDKMDDAKRTAAPGPGDGETGSHVSEGKADKGKTDSVDLSCNGEASRAKGGRGNKRNRRGEISDGIEFVPEGCISGGEGKSDDKKEDGKMMAVPGPGDGETGSHVSEGKVDKGKTDFVGLSCDGEASRMEEGRGNKSDGRGESTNGIELAAEGCISGGEDKCNGDDCLIAMGLDGLAVATAGGIGGGPAPSHCRSSRVEEEASAVGLSPEGTSASAHGQPPGLKWDPYGGDCWWHGREDTAPPFKRNWAKSEAAAAMANTVPGNDRLKSERRENVPRNSADETVGGDPTPTQRPPVDCLVSIRAEEEEAARLAADSSTLERRALGIRIAAAALPLPGALGSDGNNAAGGEHDVVEVRALETMARGATATSIQFEPTDQPATCIYFGAMRRGGPRKHYITGGPYDASIQLMAAAARLCFGPIFVESAHETNGRSNGNSRAGIQSVNENTTSKRKSCNHKGCNNQAIQAGVCRPHEERCSHGGCTNVRAATPARDQCRMGTSRGGHEAAWERRFQELLEYKSLHGDCNVKYHSNPQLAKWVVRQRKLEKSGKLSSHRVKRLEGAGFNFAAGSQYWKYMFERLRQYKSQNGDCNIPRNYPPDPPLAKWVTLQRSLGDWQLPFRRGMLEDIGFDFDFCRVDTKEDSWLMDLSEALGYKSRRGRWPPRSHPLLGSWVKNQHERYREGKLREDRVTILDAMGFKWGEESARTVSEGNVDECKTDFVALSCDDEASRAEKDHGNKSDGWGKSMDGIELAAEGSISGGEDKSNDKKEDAKRTAVPDPGEGENWPHVSDGKVDKGKIDSVGLSCVGEASKAEKGHCNKSDRRGESTDRIELAAEGSVSGGRRKM